MLSAPSAQHGGGRKEPSAGSDSLPSELCAQELDLLCSGCSGLCCFGGAQPARARAQLISQAQCGARGRTLTDVLHGVELLPLRQPRIPKTSFDRMSLFGAYSCIAKPRDASTDRAGGSDDLQRQRNGEMETRTAAGHPCSSASWPACRNLRSRTCKKQDSAEAPCLTTSSVMKPF